MLDSTSDFPDARERFPNMRVVPLYVNFGAGELPGPRRHRLATTSTSGSRRRPTLPTTSQPTPQDFLDAYEELAGYERIYSLQLSAKLSGHVPVGRRRRGRASGGDRIRVVDTETASLAVGLLALAIQRRLARGTTDEEIEALIERFKEENGVVFTVAHARVPAEGRPHRPGPGARRDAAQREADPVRRRRRRRTRSARCAAGRRRSRSSRASSRRRRENVPGLRVAIAHADAPEWIEVLTDLVAKARPQAEIELVENLGAVVGTHAGPGAVGFFWFQDEA